MKTITRRTRHTAAILIVALVAGLTTLLTGTAAPAAAMVQPFVGVTPQRLLETRSGVGNVTIDGLQQGGGVFTAGETRELPILGRGTIPASGVDSIAINVTAISPSANGFLTIFPTGSSQPTASNLNTAPGRTLPNMVIVPLGTDGKISIFNSAGTTQLAIDILGWFPAGGAFVGATPQRCWTAARTASPSTGCNRPVARSPPGRPVSCRSSAAVPYRARPSARSPST